MDNTQKVRVRFAPSPTGYLHVGGLRTALYNYLFARHHGGDFLLRIEDTDRTREVPGAVENLISSLRWAGLDYDEGPDKEGDCGPYVQSQRTQFYQKYAQQLVQSGHAYYCFCSSERLDELRAHQRENKLPIRYDKKCQALTPDEIKQRIDAGEPYVIRLNVPLEGGLSFKDIVRKKVKIAFSEMDDQVLIKSDGFPTYHLANVVDDHLMGITHVIRGEEWLYSTPKHLMMYHAFGWQAPEFAHLPLLLNPDKSKLSKRQADVATEDYRAAGYLPQALLNFVALLGWNPGDNRELFSLDELAKEFSLSRVSKSGAVFDVKKLDWMNGQYLRSADLNWVCQNVKPMFEQAGLDTTDQRKFSAAVDTARNYAAKLSEVPTYAQPFYQRPQLSAEQLAELDNEQAATVLDYYQNTISTWQQLPEQQQLDAFVKQAMAESGVKGKNYFHPLRLALFGDSSGPNIPVLINILGINETLARIKAVRQGG